jgi:inosine-uridine nucleoside N-ribohydrolase
MLNIYLKIVSVSIVLICLLSCANNTKALSKKDQISSCVLIDTDYDIDDMMAIPLVIGNKHVAGIITTEGYTYPTSATAALQKQIPQEGERGIPIIVGSGYSQGGHRDISAWPWIPYYRNIMNRINGLLPEAVMPALENPNYIQDILSATSHCGKVDVLVIGAFSSFVNYSPRLKEKINSVVITGRPLFPSRYSKNGSKIYSFNCEYDMPACQTSFIQLKDMNTIWVDVPRLDSEPEYSPSLKMVEGLAPRGLPNSLKMSLLSNLHSWEPEQVKIENGGPGGIALMWDQSTALYLTNPEIYSQKFASGKDGAYHVPDKVTPAQLNQLWTNMTNKAVNFYTTK